jgi:hypothetical protein
MTADLLNVIHKLAADCGEVRASPELLSCPLAVPGRAYDQVPSTSRARPGLLFDQRRRGCRRSREHMGGRFGGFVSSSHFVVLDQPVAVDKLYSRVPLRCLCCHEGEAACGYKVAPVRRVVGIRDRRGSPAQRAA